MLDVMGEVLAAKVEEGTFALWWIGGIGYLFKDQTGRIVCTDPYLTDSCGEQNPEAKRQIPVPVEPEDLRCDLLLTTHDHADHLDPETVKRLTRRHSMRFVGPRRCREHWEKLGIARGQIEEVVAGEEYTFDGLTVIPTFCVPNDEHVIDSVGFVLKFPGGASVYLTGDTAFADYLEYVKRHEIDVMLTVVNGQYKNMSIEDAVRLAELVQPRVVIPNHYDLFKINFVDPSAFVSRVRRSSVPMEPQVLQLGEKFVVTPERGGSAS